MNLKKNTELVFQQIADASLEANRALDDVSVIAVTKYVDIQTAEALLPLGVRHIGENRVDKFLEKYQALKDYPVTWHLIGTLQRRKVKEVIPYVDYFHALDSLKLAQEIQKRRDQVVKCFLQVNISGEESKHGFSKEELLELLPELAKLDQIEYVGLMTMAPFEADSEKLKEIFKETQALQAEIREKQIPNMPMTELSMGMSRDFKEAIQFGATFVRIGTAFFIEERAMSLKDKFDKFIDYFTEDGEETTNYQPQQEETVRPAVSTSKELPAPAQSGPAKDANITRLHARQQELAMQSHRSDEKVTIDVRYPRKYEDATEIVNLLAGNESILIDFQYMTEVQARRCLDYLDGARHVLAGNMKKVASTMYLLTPVNVIVNIEDIKLPDESQSAEFGFDIKRNRAK